MGYGTRYTFEYRGVQTWGKGAVIMLVAERYAQQFGPIDSDKANEIYIRLATKYCAYPGSEVCIRSIELVDYVAVAHPLKQRKAMERTAYILKIDRQQVEQATRLSIFPYVMLDSAKSPCRLCGSPTLYEVTNAQGSCGYAFREHRPSKQRNLFSICRNPLCKALVEKFHSAFAGGKELPMAFVLKEITKNGDRSKAIGDIAEATFRNLPQVRGRANRQRRGEGCSPSGHSVREGFEDRA